MKNRKESYFTPIGTAARTLLTGLRLTWKHLKNARNLRTPEGVQDARYFLQKDGIVTTQYPFESIPVPANGRYKLHNEIDDCIVCDKCAKICPVDCIDIVPIKATEEIGKTSDGTSKRLHAARFDIDMSKCCFCGLCTTVCPTECLTMTPEYDFSDFDLKSHNFSFADMLEQDILSKKREAEAAQAAKAKPAATSSSQVSAEKPASDTPKVGKPVFKPKVQMKKPDAIASPQKEEKDTASTLNTEEATKPKPVFRPKVIVKRKTETEEKPNKDEVINPENKVEEKPKPIYRPKVMVPKKNKGSEES